MDVPGCPIYAWLHVLHFNLYIPLGFFGLVFQLVVGVLCLWLGMRSSGWFA